MQRVYGCPGLLRTVTRGVPRRSHDALALGVLRALREGGCSAAGQTDAVLVNAAAAGHVAVARWAMQVGRLGVGQLKVWEAEVGVSTGGQGAAAGVGGQAAQMQYCTGLHSCTPS